MAILHETVVNHTQKIPVLEEHLDSLWKKLQDCTLCPRQCRVNRLKNQRGFCGAGDRCVVYTAFLHRGEEPPLSGERGSGTIFFSGCNLRCVYCQNYRFSHSLCGKTMSGHELTMLFLRLQERGAHNINLVTPAHFLPHILQALLEALREGLTLPVIYNTSGYETTATLRTLEGIIDVYLADLRYIDPRTADEYSNAYDYPGIAQAALIEMHRQLKEVRFQSGLMTQGVVARHLLLPGHLQESRKALQWLKRTLPNAYLSVMTQYQPYHKASGYTTLNRALSEEEYKAIKEFIETIGITKGWLQEFVSDQTLAGVYFKPSIEELL